MDVKIKINEVKKEPDFFPCLFANGNKTVIILANERTSEKTFAGMVIYSDNKTNKGTIGHYSTGWTYDQFKRLPKNSTIDLTITQEQ